MHRIKPVEPDDRIFKRLLHNKDGVPTSRGGRDTIVKYYDVVINRFREYDSNKENLENIKPLNYSDSKFSPELPEKLKKLYNSRDELYKTFKDEIYKKPFEECEQLCPYCGTKIAPDTLDHYMPKAIFPEFSIYSYNLIPVCSVCNRNKHEKWLDDSGSRLILNPYFDKIIDEQQFLKCSLKLGNNAIISIDYYIDDKVNIEDYYLTIIKNHFEKLDLNQRYVKLSVDRFGRFVWGYIDDDEKEFVDVSISELKRDVKKSINGLRKYGKNYWEKVFLEELKESDEILKLISEKNEEFKNKILKK